MKIRAWWLNRVIIYCIPAIFVYDLPFVAANFSVDSAMTNASIAILIVLFFEQYLFSYKVDLVDEEIRYSEGLLFGKKIVLKREEIMSACSLPTPIFIQLNSARLLLTTKDGREHVLSLASFRPVDVARIVGWLPTKVKRCGRAPPR